MTPEQEMIRKAEDLAAQVRYEDDHGCISCRMLHGEVAALLKDASAMIARLVAERDAARELAKAIK